MRENETRSPFEDGRIDFEVFAARPGVVDQHLIVFFQQP